MRRVVSHESAKREFLLAAVSLGRSGAVGGWESTVQ